MKHVRKSLFLIACAAAAFVLLFAITEGLTRLLIFPVLAIIAFAAVYLVRQGEKDIENNIKDGVRYTAEDMEAEQWIKHDLAPRTLSYVKHKHWPMIIYGFLFFTGLAYLWNYLTLGSASALQNTIYAGILFAGFIVYALLGPRFLNLLYKRVPKHYRKYLANDWVRGYLFLLPLTAAAYLLSPFINAGEPVAHRAASLPGFLLGYTLLFLSAAAILYLYKESKKEEEKRLKRSVRDYLRNKEA